MKIAVATPVFNLMHPKFVRSLMSLRGHSGWIDATGTYVHMAREKLLDIAIVNDIDYLLWADADMKFPPDSLERLLAHKLPLVGANYIKRSPPHTFTAVKKVAWKDSDEGKILITDDSTFGLETVEAMGLGLALLDMHALGDCDASVGEVYPWFAHAYVNGRHVGEDTVFCRHLVNAGIPIYVDHDLSKQVKHVGDYEYGYKNAPVL